VSDFLSTEKELIVVFGVRAVRGGKRNRKKKREESNHLSLAGGKRKEEVS